MVLNSPTVTSTVGFNMQATCCRSVLILLLLLLHCAWALQNLLLLNGHHSRGISGAPVLAAKGGSPTRTPHFCSPPPFPARNLGDLGAPLAHRKSPYFAAAAPLCLGCWLLLRGRCLRCLLLVVPRLCPLLLYEVQPLQLMW